MTNTFEEMQREELKIEYQAVLEKICGGKVMGILINEYDIHALVVGAYYCGKYFESPFTKIWESDE